MREGDSVSTLINSLPLGVSHPLPHSCAGVAGHSPFFPGLGGLDSAPHLCIAAEEAGYLHNIRYCY